MTTTLCLGWSAEKKRMADNYEYMARGWTRHEAFADILRRYPPRREYRRGDIVVLEVRFGVKDNTYCYRSPDNIYKAGDLVEASVGKLRDDVLETLEKSNEVYNNILEDLYLSDMLELRSELDALQTMFAINGLLDSDFDIKT